MVEWLAIGLSLIAIIISVVAYRSSLPRLKVSANGPVMLVGPPTLRGAVQVRVDNNGGASALVRRVSLRSVDSNVFASPDRTLPNPELPFAVDAHGGVAVWNFDYRQLQRDADVTFRETPLAVRAEIEVGSKRYRQRGRVWVNVPGDSRLIESRWARVRRRCRRWIDEPVGFPIPQTIGDDGRVALTIRKHGRGQVRPFAFTLVKELPDGRHERVRDVEQVPVPRIWPWQTEVIVSAPIVDDAGEPVGVQFWWTVTNRSGAGNGFSALRTSELPQIN